MIAYWHRAKDGLWLCEEVGDYYPYSYGEMVHLWRRFGINAMRYW